MIAALPGAQPWRNDATNRGEHQYCSNDTATRRVIF